MRREMVCENPHKKEFRSILPGYKLHVADTPPVNEGRPVSRIELMETKLHEIQPDKYHPKNQVRHEQDYIRRKSRRRSRCDGVHDAKERDCGSPRCKTKGRAKILNNPENKNLRRSLRQSYRKIL